MQIRSRFYLAARAFGLSVVLSTTTTAESPYQIEWTRQLASQGLTFGLSVAVDADGNPYIAGNTEGPFAPPYGAGTGAFIAKYDPSGELNRVQQLITPGYHYGYSVTLDATGNAFLSGLDRSGDQDGYLAKFDESGNELWVRRIDSNEIDSVGESAVDASGNVYVTGYTWGALGTTNYGGTDSFVAKYDTDGNSLWTTQFGSGSSDRSNSLALDAAQNIYVGGFTQNSDFADALLTKLNSAGEIVWTRQFGTEGRESICHLALDSAGNAYVTGYTGGELYAPHTGNFDVFVAKFDHDGNQIWSHQFGTATRDEAQGIDLDSNGNVFITGRTGLPGPTNTPRFDAFVCKYSPSGSQRWCLPIATPTEDVANSIALDAAGNAYVTGYTYGNLIDGQTMRGATAFLIKLAPAPEPTSLAVACLSGLALLGWRTRS